MNSNTVIVGFCGIALGYCLCFVIQSLSSSSSPQASSAFFFHPTSAVRDSSTAATTTSFSIDKADHNQRQTTIISATTTATMSSNSYNNIYGDENAAACIEHEIATALGCVDVTTCQHVLTALVRKQQVWNQTRQQHVEIARRRAPDHSSATTTSNIPLPLTENHPVITWVQQTKPRVLAYGRHPGVVPDYQIVGLPKAGTSHLYRILESHVNVAPFGNIKENCMLRWTDLHYRRFEAELIQTNQYRGQPITEYLRTWHRAMHVRQTKRIQDTATVAGAASAKTNTSSTATTITTATKTVNGCLSMADITLRIHYMRAAAASASAPAASQHSANNIIPALEGKKFFLLFRDPADWLWSAWNFWTDPTIDDYYDQGSKTPCLLCWATPGMHFRSPELFHELVASAGGVLQPKKTKRKQKRSTNHTADRSSTSPSSFINMWREQSIETPRRLIALVGRPNILFLRSEDMLPSSNDGYGYDTNSNNKKDVLDVISDFTGLERSGFVDKIAQQMHNCNNEKGESTQCNDQKENSALGADAAATTVRRANTNNKIGGGGTTYAITGHREMLAETRELIYLQFAAECRIWAKEFGIHYPRCLEAVA